MLTTYVCGGPNPRKVTIMLEELGWAYEWTLVDLYVGDHRKPEFLAINPNGRLPALHDTENDLLLWESGVIMQYLAEKSGQFLPQGGSARYEVLKWLHFQLTHAPYLGNAHLYRVLYEQPMTFDVKRFTIESARIYGVLDKQLANSPFVAGDEYSIADMAWYPWIEYHPWQGHDLRDFPHVGAWFSRMSKRPAVLAGAAIPWPFGEFGPSQQGRTVKDGVDARLRHPDFALRATEKDSVRFHLTSGRKVDHIGP